MRRTQTNQHNQQSQNRLQVARFLAASLLATLASCHSHEGMPTGATCPTTMTLTYANFGKSFMQAYCVRCHSVNVQGVARNGAPIDQNYDAQVEVRSDVNLIDLHVGSGPFSTNTAMPEEDPMPTVDERRKLSEWLACGAP